LIGSKTRKRERRYLTFAYKQEDESSSKKRGGDCAEKRVKNGSEKSGPDVGPDGGGKKETQSLSRLWSSIKLKLGVQENRSIGFEGKQAKD